MSAPQSFASTRWSLVRAAGEAGTPAARTALSELCATYWLPLYAFVRRQGCTPEEAEDTVQGCFAQLLSRDDFRSLAPERGRFRAFLLASVKHYLSNQRDHERAAKRGGGRVIVGLDLQAAEERYRGWRSDARSPEAEFDREWALTLLDRVRHQLRDEAAAAGKLDRFELLSPFLTSESEGTLRATAETLGMSESAAKVAVHRLRQRFGELLRSEIAHTVESPAEVDDEVRALFEALRVG
jgi:RNA polymerase sigma-70 factor (ECF subfamily)